MADEVLNYESQMAAMSDEEKKSKTDEFKERYNKGESLDSLLYEAFCGSSYKQQTCPRAFLYVQVMVGLFFTMVTFQRCAETLTATMPVYLNALAGKGVHVVTVNEYFNRT